LLIGAWLIAGLAVLLILWQWFILLASWLILWQWVTLRNAWGFSYAAFWLAN
jgi:hypothetical protein